MTNDEGDGVHDGEPDDRPDEQRTAAEELTDKNLHAHPDEATGEIDPHNEEDTRQTTHGLTQKNDETTR